MDMWIAFLQRETSDTASPAQSPAVIEDHIVNVDKTVSNSSEKTSNGSSYFARLLGV
jgi:hypothetical protein